MKKKFCQESPNCNPQLPSNAVTGNVKFSGNHMSGNATYRELARFSANGSLFPQIDNRSTSHDEASTY